MSATIELADDSAAQSQTVRTQLRLRELILEAQQQAIDERPGYSFYNLNIDAGSMWARRLIEQMVRTETPAHERPGVIPLRAA